MINGLNWMLNRLFLLPTFWCELQTDDAAATDWRVDMPFRGKAKAPYEMTTGELIATLIAFTVIPWLIATSCIVSIIQKFSADFEKRLVQETVAV